MKRTRIERYNRIRGDTEIQDRLKFSVTTLWISFGNTYNTCQTFQKVMCFVLWECLYDFKRNWRRKNCRFCPHWREAVKEKGKSWLSFSAEVVTSLSDRSIINTPSLPPSHLGIKAAKILSFNHVFKMCYQLKNLSLTDKLINSKLILSWSLRPDSHFIHSRSDIKCIMQSGRHGRRRQIS